jgi:membrane protease YdiL (CAAX protease family)
MSTDRPDDLDAPTLSPVPPDDREGRPRDDDRAPPPRRPGFGFWLAVAWCLLYVVVTQVVAGIVFGIPIYGIALIPELQQNGGAILADPNKLNDWMVGPRGRVATLILVAVTQFTGLLLSWILLRQYWGRSWKRRIALTRGPTRTHALLVLIGFPALIALGAAIEAPINKYLPSLQDVLDSLGVKFEMEGANEFLPKLIRHSPWALAIFAIAVSPGICEEVFCRGFLAHGLSGRYATWAVVLIVSFLFGCLHLDPKQGFGAMLLGAAIHGAYLATRSLWVAMAVHFANNGLAVVHFNAQLYPVLEPLERLLAEQPVLLVGSALLLFLAVCVALYQTRCRLAVDDVALPPWEPKWVGHAEVPPPGTGTVVTHDPLSVLSATLVAAGAVAFGLVLAFA